MSELNVTMEATSDTTKILEKGPEYLRKQMELEGETKGHMSAVERLAASKPKYVKSQQVVNSIQEPAISLGSASVSSTGSSTRSSNRGRNALAVGGVVKSCSPGQVRRTSSKKRPDSLLLYRQKCELLGGAANDRKHHITRKLLANNTVNKNVPLLKECESEGDNKSGAATPGERGAQGAPPWRRRRGVESGTKVTGALLTVPECERRSGRGVGRSHSDISSRYSKNFADFDAFFMYCGLDGEIVESLGRENFSARSDEIAIKFRSVSVSTTEGGFSKSSGGSDGLLQVELHDNIRQGTSVIERNARVIKWLYSCKNAKDSGKKLRDLN
ncbi:protein FAM110C [Hippoglossus hippoglossus]|uniref:protein FAM110C n=1 Tax=Hippoglossus hippoglossus TaxID=8267 RepID=UPI00148E4515|nr:protein FAM110C [Hippoglossus hippoglossus]XP_034999305.2 protein FAM110C [Hippoglossus stenolepis]